MKTHFLRMFWSQFFCVACKSQHLMWNRFWAWNSISNQPGFGESISRGVAWCCLCHLCRLFWLPNSQRWSQHVQFTGCHGNCLHTSDASGDWLHVFYIHCILFGKYTKSLRNSLKRSPKIDVSIVNLRPCQWLWRVALLILGQFPLFRSFSFLQNYPLLLPRRGRFKVPLWFGAIGIASAFRKFVGVPCCFSSSGCLIIYEIWIYYRFMMIYDVSRCIVMFLLGISSHAAKKYQTCVFASLNGLFLGKIYRKP